MLSFNKNTMDVAQMSHAFHCNIYSVMLPKFPIWIIHFSSNQNIYSECSKLVYIGRFKTFNHWYSLKNIVKILPGLSYKVSFIFSPKVPQFDTFISTLEIPPLYTKQLVAMLL